MQNIDNHQRAGSTELAASSSEPTAVLFCTDERFWLPMTAAIASLLSSNPGRTFRVFVCSTKPSPEHEAAIQQCVRSLGNSTVESITYNPADADNLPPCHLLPLAAYLRLFMTEFLPPEIRRVLYLDCDVIVRHDLTPLLHANIGDAMLGAVLEPWRPSTDNEGLGFNRKTPYRYFNSGVMIVNLKRWRQEKVVDAFVECVTRHYSHIRFADQDV